LYQLIPGSVCNALGKAMVAKHPVNVQVLKGDELVAVHQLPAEFVGEIPATVGYSLMNMLDNALALAVFGRAFGGLAQAALGLGNYLFVVAEKAGILDFLARAKRGKGFQAHIYTDHSGHGRQGFGYELAREASVPVAKTIAANIKRLDGSNNGTVQLDFDGADFRQSHAAIIKKTPAAILLRVSKRVVTLLPAKAGIAGGFAILDATKERLKGQVNTTLRVLLCLSMSAGQPFIAIAPLGKESVGVIKRERHAMILPCISAYFQRLVVRPATCIQHVLKLAALALVGI